MEEGKPGSRKERIRTMLLRREKTRLDVLHEKRRRLRERNKFIPKDRHQRITQGGAQANTRYTLAGTFTLLNGMTSGTSANQRIGRSILLKTVYVCENFDSAAGGSFTRTILFYDTATNGATPTAAQLLEDVTSMQTTPLNEDNKWRFKVLFDCVMTVETGSTNPACFREEIPIWQNTIFNANNFGDVRDIATGGLFVFRVSEGVAVFDNFTYTAYFTDA